MLSVLRVHLPSDIPIVGCELTPYVLLRRPNKDKSVISEDVSESAPIDGYFLRYKWYRIQSDKKVAICSIHPSEQATLQCLGCVKAKIPVTKSYHCSPKCFSDAWQHHRVLHERAASAVNENGNEEEEIFGRFNSTGSGVTNASLAFSQSSGSLANGTTPLYPAAITQRNGSETWFEVGRAKTYTPSADDIGHTLKFECVVVDAETKLPVGPSSTILTSRVIPAPCPTPRRMFSVSGVDIPGHLDLDGRLSSSGTFTVLSYNILSDAYATNELYSYCPSWALSWTYRRQNLLREIVGYRADIVCLQEVQSNHFEEFFAPELDKHGYVHTLLKGLEKIAASADIPMLVCGDFNSMPGSAPHTLLALGKVDPMHQDLVVDPLGILRPASKLTHQLPLVSAYSSFARMGVGLGLEQQRRRMDPNTNEPLFTNCTRDFIGTHDYIFYSADSLTVESLLELLDEESLRKDTALPSPEWSSDHIALLAEFRSRCKG
ncbi:hypothetical protein RDI58_025751 [Solanum bulbocastanum]|uniref:poly(A)-specific ribonuclease n=1 Tax=Solanum bulbocastanum TaxID=147425 RepID=A0AAN8T794_SOLBU